MSDDEAPKKTPEDLTKEEEAEIDDNAESLVNTIVKDLKEKEEAKQKIKEKLLEQKKKDKKKFFQGVNKALAKNDAERAKSAAEAAAIMSAYSSKARTELLVDPSEVAFHDSFLEVLKKDENLLHNLIDLDWQLYSKRVEWKKAFRHYSVFATVLTLIILICTSLVVVFEVLSTSVGKDDDKADKRRRLDGDPYVDEKPARAIVAILAFIATVLTGWLSSAVWKSIRELG